MTAVGLELTNFIDPSLTWKTVSKGRNTSRRSRKSILKSLELGQDKGKENLKRSSGEHSSESDKSDLSNQGRVFGNMEHVPIKKRRFLLRTPSPPPPSPKHCEESQELDSGKCTVEQQTFANGSTEQEVTGTDSYGLERKTCVMDSNVENTINSFEGVPLSCEDFSGIAILAAAACDGVLDSTVGDVEKSNTASLLKSDDNESFPSPTIVQENIAVSRSPAVLEKAIGQLVEDDCVADSPNNSIQNVCLKNTIDDGTSHINELSGAVPNELVVSAINNEETAECCELPDTVNSIALHAADAPSELPIEATETTDKTTETSEMPRNYRLQWDLNTMMDDWDHPDDDNLVDSCMQSTDVASANATCSQNSVSVEASMQRTDVAPISAMCFQNSVNVEASTPGKGLLAVIANESGDRFNGPTLACTVSESKAIPGCGGFTRMATASNLSGISFDSHVVETSSKVIAVAKSCQDLAVAETDSDIDKKSHNLVSSKGQSTLQTELHEIDFSLGQLSANASCEVKATDFGHTNYKEWDALDEHDEENITYPSVSPNFLGASSSKIAALGASLEEHATFVDAKEIKPMEAFSELASSQSSCFEMPIVKSKDPDRAHCSNSMEALHSPISIIAKNKSMSMVNYSTTSDASTCDQLMESVPSVMEVKSVTPPSKAAKHLGCHTLKNYGVSDSHVFDKTSSELTKNNENMVNGRGCDSHLEDGELSYSVGHGWEDNEGEDAETEHVDYDFDDRDGIFFEAAGECGKPRCGLDTSVPLQQQNTLSTVDANVAESSKRDSALFRVCFGGQLKGKDRVEGDCKDCGRSNIETDRPEKDFDNDSLCNCRGASASGSGLQCSDIISRSSNFGIKHQADRSGTTRAVPCGLPKNVEMKRVETDPGPEEGEEKVVRDSEDTSVCRPRIISTSRSGYNPMRRGSPGERDNFHGMRNCRDGNLDSNSRGKFDRFTGGINRGFREGYHRHGVLNHFGKRERTFSPLENRLDSNYQQSDRKARSSSRTRSPDSRSEARMGRTRLPYQPPDNSGNHIRERRSPVRVFNRRPRFNRLGSPGRLRSNDCHMKFHDTSRDPDYEENDHYRRKPLFMRNDRRYQSRCKSFSPDYRPNTRVVPMRSPYQSTAGPSRGRRSPVRLFRHNHRYDNEDSPRRFNDNLVSSRGNDYNDRGHIDSKEHSALDENEKDIFAKANDRNFGDPGPLEQMTIMDANESKSLESLSQLPKSQSCGFKPVVKLKDSDQAKEDMVSISKSSSTPDAFRCDNPMDLVPNDTGTPMSVNLIKHPSCVTPPQGNGVSDLHILGEASSELTKINANVRNGRGYECHLEDGELREPLGHNSEKIEGKDFKTERKREGVFVEAATDSFEVLGEVRAGDCEKPSCFPDKSSEANCYLQHQSCLSTIDTKVAENIKRESILRSVCAGVQLKGEDRVEEDYKDERSKLENDRIERNFNDDTMLDCGGASASARGLQCSDVISSKMDSLHQADCSGVRHQSFVQKDMLCGPSRNLELKTAVPDSGQEGGERVVRVSEDTSLRTWRPRIATTLRSGFNPMRRGSPEERENFYGTRMVNDRDTNLDCNSRSKFDRFSCGINRGFRGGYHRPAVLNHFNKGGRSLSPPENRLDSHYHRNHRKSRSRSRTRSPEFRSEARMGRTRLPYQPPGQSANHIKERRSPVRVFNQRPRFNSIGSPRRLRSNDCPVRFHDASRDPDYEEGDHYQRKPLFVRNDQRSLSRSRSFSPDCRPDTRGGPIRGPYQPTAGPIRGRRSPVRVFRQVQKYDNGESSGRFNDNPQSSRGNDYNNNGGDDFRRKPRNIFERIHPIRHQDEDGNNRRFQYDGQDNLNNRNFRRNENYGRGGGRRPMDFRREDRGNNVRYDSDRTFNSGPKQFGGMRGS